MNKGEIINQATEWEKNQLDELENVKEKSLEEIIQEVADEEGMTYDETMKLFKQGLREANRVNKVNHKKKAKNRAKNKQARKARKRNR